MCEVACVRCMTEIYSRVFFYTAIGNDHFPLLFRFVVICGDGEYIIYTAMALRNKAFGSALEFVWAVDSSE